MVFHLYDELRQTHMTVLPRVFIICSLTLVKVGHTFFSIWILSNFILFYCTLLYFISIYLNNFFLISFIMSFHLITFSIFFTLFFVLLSFLFILFNLIRLPSVAYLSLPLFVSSSVSTAWRGQTTTLTLVPILHCQLSPDSNRLNCLQNLFYLKFSWTYNFFWTE